MALYTIADLHLSTNPETNKSMDIFGARWQNYMEKIQKHWKSVVNENDTVVIPGDVSWGMTLDDSLDDFKFLDALPGKKYLGKGNHDFWWNTAAKIKRFFSDNNLNSLEILYNNAYYIQEGVIICGTRGWFLDDTMQKTVGEVDFEKISAREAMRFELSLSEAQKLSDAHFETDGVRPPIYAFLHFPPIWGDFTNRSILSLLEKYEVDTCCYGHIHGMYSVQLPQSFGNTKLKFTASDYLDFYPYKLI